MSVGLDEAAIERAVRTFRVALPRTALAGRVGGVLGVRAGGAMELHDFREYQAGDDVRQLDWNAVARTGQLIVRTRREEVSPRLEIVLDASRSMAVSPAKEARARELAIVLSRTAATQGLETVVVVASQRAEARTRPPVALLRDTPFDGRLALPEVLRQRPVLRACGIRIVISDFLFEQPLDPVVSHLAERAAVLGLVQVLAPDDEAPEAAGTLALVDSETGERVERELGERVLTSYRRRFEAHQAALETAARRARAHRVRLPSDESLDDTLRTRLLGTLLEVRA